MNRYTITESEKNRILNMHKSAALNHYLMEHSTTKRRYLKESNGSGIKVKLFSDTGRKTPVNTGIIESFSQDGNELIMNITLTSDSYNKKTAVFSKNILKITNGGDTYLFSEQIEKKLSSIIEQENLDTTPMKASVYNQMGGYKDSWFVYDLEVHGYGVSFKYRRYSSEEQTSLDEEQRNSSTPRGLIDNATFSCGTKTFRTGKGLTDSKFSNDLTNIMMGMCDEYAMNNKDGESDMA